MDKITQRIERETGISDLTAILAERIKPTDLQSLLLEVYRRRLKHRSSNAVFSDYVSNKFTLPSQCDPALLREWDRIAFSHLPMEFHAVEVSPVSPIGSVSCLAPISQDWVLTTIRNMEVVADPTNALALECAMRREKLMRSEPANATSVHLACSHRVIRTQRYQSSNDLQHFRLFSLCSAGRNTENVRFWVYAIILHTRFYLESLRDFLGPDVPLRVAIIDLSRNSNDCAILDKNLESLKSEFTDVEVGLLERQSQGTGYYIGWRFKLFAKPKRGPEMELVDGGGTDWTQKLLNNAKEHLIISGIGSERLCGNFKAHSPIQRTVTSKKREL